MSLRLLLSGILFLVLIGYSCKKSDTNNPPPPPPPTPPGCAANVSPANGAFVSSGSLTLNWSAVTGATGYDVYLGASAATATVIASNVSGTSYNYMVPVFAQSQALFWYVQPKNANGGATGCNSIATYFTATVIQAPPAFGYYVVGYFPSYRSLSDVPDVKFRMTNAVMYAFYGVNSSGTLSAPSSPAATLIAVRDKARTNGAKVFLAINDGAAGNFKNMAATAAGRNNFIKDVMNNVRANNLDGVVIDWEFPTTTDGTDITYTLLMKELSDSLHRYRR